MTDQAMSLLRRRMIEDMSIRKLTPATQHTYVRFVKEFSMFFGRSPDKAAFEDVRRYQLHLSSRGISPFTINAAVSAFRFFFRVTLRRHDIADHIPFVSQPQKLPVILSPDEVARLLAAARGPKHKATLGIAYGAGLRASEIRMLKVTDIDSQRMMIRVEQGKGGKCAVKQFTALCVRKIYVALDYETARGRGVPLKLTTHKLSPFYRQTSRIDGGLPCPNGFSSVVQLSRAMRRCHLLRSEPGICSTANREEILVRRGCASLMTYSG
jgi:site-specific recombinase XerD